MLGVLAKLLAVRTGDVESRVVRFYHKYFGLERLIAISLLMMLVAAAVDAYVLVEWLNNSSHSLLPQAAVAQSLIVIGANLLFGALAAAMVDYETPSS